MIHPRSFLTTTVGATIVAVLLGILTGVGAFTGYYGEGLSYFSRDPQACTNCHIMQPQFDAWQKASHHTAATCVDCHLPHDFVNKYIAKAENGWNHSRAFTMQDFPEPIKITSKNSQILQDNCIACHGDFVHDILSGNTKGLEASLCVHCHRSVGHGETVGLGGPERASENADQSNKADVR